MKVNLFILYLATFLSVQSCSTCDCFDEEDYVFTFDFDLESYGAGMSINEFLSANDSLGNPKYYRIEVYSNDSDFRKEYFDRMGDGQGGSIAQFILWNSPKKVVIDIDTLGIKHEFTKFEVEGNEDGSFKCKCFTPTRKMVTMDDSIHLDALNSHISIKKL